eukprot:gene49593-28791_t
MSRPPVPAVGGALGRAPSSTTVESTTTGSSPAHGPHVAQSAVGGDPKRQREKSAGRGRPELRVDPADGMDGVPTYAAPAAPPLRLALGVAAAAAASPL